MRKQIFNDLFRINPKKKYDLMDIIVNLRHPGFSYLLFFRIASNTKSKLIYYLSKFVLKYLGYKFGFQIVPNTDIGNGFYIGHFGHVIINPNTKIGDNCNISPGVTIGKMHNGKKEGAPKIGNLVWIGTNAIIVGKIEIGDNVVIAPGAYVNFDVPSESIVLGNPGKIIEKNNPTEFLVNNIVI